MKNKTTTKPFYNSTIPSDWEMMTLGELGTFSKGKGILKEQIISKGFPCVRYGEIYTTHDFIIREFKSFINEDIANESKEIKKGDILFAGSGETVDEIGKAAAYTGSKKAFAGGDVIILSTNGKTNVECLAYALETDFSKKQKRVLGQGNSVVHIYPSDLAKLKIPLPPLPEQKAIAHILGLMDKAIYKNNQLIAKKELRKKWLMRQLLTGKKRLKGFGGKWEDVELGELLEYEQPTKYLVKDTLYNDAFQTPVLTAGKTFILGYTNEETGICTDFPVIIFDDFTTASKYVDFPFKAKSSAMKLLRPKTNAKLKFVYEAMQLMNYAVGGHERHWISKFVYLTIPCPPLEEQTAIAQVLQAADKEIQLLKTKSEKLMEQKKGLMQQLLTGKKRLNLDALNSEIKGLDQLKRPNNKK